MESNNNGNDIKYRTIRLKTPQQILWDQFNGSEPRTLFPQRLQENFAAYIQQQNEARQQNQAPQSNVQFQISQFKSSQEQLSPQDSQSDDMSLQTKYKKIDSKALQKILQYRKGLYTDLNNERWTQINKDNKRLSRYSVEEATSFQDIVNKKRKNSKDDKPQL